MEISVLATKCRFCGEGVGRPRDETRSLTIDDLGGETVQQYAPSSSVMEAMESFRSEAETTSDVLDDSVTNRGAIFGEKDAGGGATDDGLPQLDERSQSLASLAMPSVGEGVKKKRGGGGVSVDLGPWIKKAGIFAGLVAAMIILYFGSVNVMARKPQEPARQHPNRAEQLLAAGDSSLEALEVALAAESRESHSDNVAITAKARKAVVNDIQALLNKADWTMEDLNAAFKMSQRAIDIDPSEDNIAVREEVQRERFMYSMVLIASDGEAEAKLSLQIPPERGGGSEQVTVKKGDMLRDRFEVVSIGSDRVSLLDTKRNSRMVQVNTRGEVTTP
jgi:hypothetical protein